MKSHLLTYNIRIVDCETGEEFSLKRVHATAEKGLSVSCASMKFEPTHLFKSQRAGLIVKQLFGQNVVGLDSVVLHGVIKLNVFSQPINRHWVL